MGVYTHVELQALVVQARALGLERLVCPRPCHSALDVESVRVVPCLGSPPRGVLRGGTDDVVCVSVECPGCGAYATGLSLVHK